MITADNIDLKEEKETLFITLYARAIDFQSPNSILHDAAAADLVKRINYDFSKHAMATNNVMVIRAKEFDDWINTFIREHANATIVYLGCGLDTRILRINPPASVQWFDVDYPEVINLRKTLFVESANYRMIGSSIIEPEWLNRIPQKNPTLIVAEGVFEYIAEGEVRTLLDRVISYFKSGELIFDVMNSFAIESGKKKLATTTGAVHKWAVDDIHNVDKLNVRMKRIKSLSLFRSRYMRKLTVKERLLYGTLSIVPAFRNMLRMLRYRF
jgi:O-methyltransferase involved in polyketide biosynthesis